jgi:hypothetical protein
MSSIKPKKMHLCPICGRHLCDHTPSERGQTTQEMMGPVARKEFKAWANDDEQKKIRSAKKVRTQQIIAREKESR